MGQLAVEQFAVLSECCMYWQRKLCWCDLCDKDDGGGLVIDSRRLIICRALSRDAVRCVASQKKMDMTKVTTDSRNLHLVRESCMSSCVNCLSNMMKWNGQLHRLPHMTERKAWWFSNLFHWEIFMESICLWYRLLLHLSCVSALPCKIRNYQQTFISATTTSIDVGSYGITLIIGSESLYCNHFDRLWKGFFG